MVLGSVVVLFVVFSCAKVGKNLHNLAKGVKQAVQEDGWLGVLTGGLKAAAGGISAVIFFGFLAALLCKPKDKS